MCLQNGENLQRITRLDASARHRGYAFGCSKRQLAIEMTPRP
jgi:hypothetical protein